MLSHVMLFAEIETARGDFTLRARFEVAEGEICGIFGPSGSGKTTLLETLAGLISPRVGLVRVDDMVLVDTDHGTEIPLERRHISMVRQHLGLFDHLNVRDNIYYSQRVDPELAALLIDRLGLGGLLERRIGQLSGGQAHRVAIARALSVRSSLVMLDEPFSGLDHRLQESLSEVVVEVVKQLSIPCLFVAHELRELERTADSLLLLVHGEVLAKAPVAELYRQPVNVHAAELLGFVVLATRSGHVAFHPSWAKVGGSHLAKVIDVRVVDATSEALVQMEDVRFRLQVDGDWQSGEMIGLDIERVVYFDADGQALGEKVHPEGIS